MIRYKKIKTVKLSVHKAKVTYPNGSEYTLTLNITQTNHTFKETLKQYITIEVPMKKLVSIPLQFIGVKIDLITTRIPYIIDTSRDVLELKLIAPVVLTNTNNEQTVLKKIKVSVPINKLIWADDNRPVRFHMNQHGTAYINLYPNLN